MDKKIALVSGANRGIGLAIATGLAKEGVHVLLGCRDIKKGQAVCDTLQTADLTLTPVQLDTTDNASVANLAQYIEQEYGRLDILVNNAGISHDYSEDLSPTERIEKTLAVNVTGLVRMTEAMTSLLSKSSHARIVNISSELASFGKRIDPEWIYKEFYLPTYAASKAAVNALTLSYAKQLQEQGITVCAVCPGLTATEATNFQGRPVEEGAAIAIQTALLDDNSHSGTFENDSGPLPW